MGVVYAIRATTSTGFEDTVTRAREELAHEGFGILTEIDVAATMKKKLDEDMQPYLILGACAPQLAWKALQAQPDLGVLLPCNVVVYVDAAGRTIVSAMEPKAALELIGDPVVDEVAKEVSARLQRVVERVVAA